MTLPGLRRPAALNARLHAAVPGGAHTYAKGDDQYPENLPPPSASSAPPPAAPSSPSAATSLLLHRRLVHRSDTQCQI
jgi:hypothetical protein